MAIRQSLGALGLDKGLTQLHVVDFLNPPPAADANEITGFGEPEAQQLQISKGFDMGGFDI